MDLDFLWGVKSAPEMPKSGLQNTPDTTNPTIAESTMAGNSDTQKPLSPHEQNADAKLAAREAMIKRVNEELARMGGSSLPETSVTAEPVKTETQTLTPSVDTFTQAPTQNPWEKQTPSMNPTFQTGPEQKPTEEAKPMETPIGVQGNVTQPDWTKTLITEEPKIEVPQTPAQASVDTKLLGDPLFPEPFKQDPVAPDSPQFQMDKTPEAMDNPVEPTIIQEENPWANPASKESTTSTQQDVTNVIPETVPEIVAETAAPVEEPVPVKNEEPGIIKPEMGKDNHLRGSDAANNFIQKVLENTINQQEQLEAEIQTLNQQEKDEDARHERVTSEENKRHADTKQEIGSKRGDKLNLLMRIKNRRAMLENPDDRLTDYTEAITAMKLGDSETENKENTPKMNEQKTGESNDTSDIKAEASQPTVKDKPTHFVDFPVRIDATPTTQAA